MLKNRLVLPFFFLFFLLSFVNVNAFTQFNANPNFNSDINGYAFYNFISTAMPNNCLIYCFFNPTIYNTTYGFYPVWNSTNKSLILNPNPNVDYTYGVYLYSVIQPLNSIQFYQSFNWSDYSNNVNIINPLFLPSWREGIIRLEYRVNDTNNIDLANSRIKVYSNGNLINEFQLVPSSTWDNQTFFITPTLNNRNITLYMILGFGNGIDNTSVSSPRKIEIKRFSFYTLDDETILPSVYSDTFAQGRCNTTNSATRTASGSSGSNYGGYIWKFTAFNNNVIDSLGCVVYQLGNMTFTRRMTEFQQVQHASDTWSYYAISRDLAGILYECGQAGYYIIFNRISDTSTISSGMTYYYYPTTNQIDFYNSGSIALGTIINYTNYSGNYKVLYPLTTTSGQTWRFNMLDANCMGGFNPSSWWNNFNTYCNAHTVCSGNSKYTISQDCSVSQPSSCPSGYSCNPQGTDCNYATDFNGNPLTEGYGSYCYSWIDKSLSPSPLYYVINSSGTYIQSCPQGQTCFQQAGHSNYNYIGCSNSSSANATVTMNFCVDSTGSVIDCKSGEAQNQGQILASGNFYSYIALGFGSLFGKGTVNDLYLDETGLALLLSVIALMVTLYYIKDKEHSGAVCSMSFLGTFLLCAFMSENSLLYIVLALMVIVDAGFLTGYFKKLFGGG